MRFLLFCMFCRLLLSCFYMLSVLLFLRALFLNKPYWGPIVCSGLSASQIESHFGLTHVHVLNVFVSGPVGAVLRSFLFRWLRRGSSEILVLRALREKRCRGPVSNKKTWEFRKFPCSRRRRACSREANRGQYLSL